MRALTKEWIAKADEDYQSANALLHLRPAVHDAVCFHCQQTAEKYLKALLAEAAATIPRTHNLEDLWALVLPLYTTARSLRRGLIFLTNFAVDTRYPGESATKRQAQSALRWATKTREFARGCLG